MKTRNLLYVLALPVLALAVLIGMQPHLLLKVPKIGFILYAISGGPVPPYMDPNIFRHHQDWLTPDAVVVATATKSGTTWLMYTLHYIRYRGNPPPFKDILVEVRWPEAVYYPGQKVQERVELLTKELKKHPVPIYKSHMAPPKVEFRPDVKYVIGVRNLADAVASMRKFFFLHRKDFSEWWGGFPPGAGEDTLNDDNIYTKFMLEDGGDGRPIVDTLILDVLRGWWPYRKHKNVLFVHYSDRIRDDEMQIKRLSEFIGVYLTQKEIETVLDHTSFEAMKKVAGRVEVPDLFAEFADQGLAPRGMSPIQRNVDAFLAKGAKRKGKEELPKKLLDGLQQKMLRDFGPEIAQWVEYGGEFPIDAEIPQGQ